MGLEEGEEEVVVRGPQGEEVVVGEEEMEGEKEVEGEVEVEEEVDKQVV